MLVGTENARTGWYDHDLCFLILTNLRLFVADFFWLYHDVYNMTCKLTILLTKLIAGSFYFVSLMLRPFYLKSSILNDTEQILFFKSSKLNKKVNMMQATISSLSSLMGLK